MELKEKRLTMVLKMWAGIMKASQCLDRTLICYINGAPLNEFKQEAVSIYCNLGRSFGSNVKDSMHRERPGQGELKRIIFASHPGER